ncbi:MAG: glutathione S-transferase family protein [Myxococcota bacterium]
MGRTLYWVNGSIPSWSVMVALNEKGLAYDAHRLRVMGPRRETRSPSFLAINPRGQAPALVEPDGTVITESLAILHYLERIAPTPALLPAEPAALARVLSRMYAVEILRKAYRPLEALFLNTRTAEQRQAAAAAPARVAEELTVWERLAGEADFVAGSTVSLADCVFYPALAYQVRRGLSLSGWPNLLRYRLRMEARPAVAKARPEGWHKPAKRNLFAEAAQLSAS